MLSSVVDRTVADSAATRLDGLFPTAPRRKPGPYPLANRCSTIVGGYAIAQGRIGGRRAGGPGGHGGADPHRLAPADDECVAAGKLEAVEPLAQHDVTPEIAAAQLFGPLLFALLTDIVPLDSRLADAVVEGLLAAVRHS